MPQIAAVTRDMDSIAASIGNNADDIQEMQEAVTNIFQNMGRDFSGNIPSLMTESMIAMEEDYQKINDTLHGYKNLLADAARDYDTFEQR